MSFAILSLGTALPPATVTQAEALRANQTLCGGDAELTNWLAPLFQQSGIRARHTTLGRDVVRDLLAETRLSASPFLPADPPDGRGPTTGQRMRHYAEYAPPLAVAAARQALERSGRPASGVTHLVTVSCTGFQAPGVDAAVIRGLGLVPTVERTHVGYMGCHGALNGLRVARAFTTSDPDACVLLAAVELCTLHIHYGRDAARLVANALFADGAAAVVGVAPVAAPAGAWRVAATGSCLVPDSASAMTWTVGDHGFAMTLSKEVPRLIATHLRPWLAGWLERQGVPLADVASWAVHPGGPRILSAVEEGLGLPRDALDASRAVLADCGNMSSPTVLFILDRLRAAGAPRPCVALGFGPGLVAEAALVL